MFVGLVHSVNVGVKSSLILHNLIKKLLFSGIEATELLFVYKENHLTGASYWAFGYGGGFSNVNKSLLTQSHTMSHRWFLAPTTIEFIVPIFTVLDDRITILVHFYTIVSIIHIENCENNDTELFTVQFEVLAETNFSSHCKEQNYYSQIKTFWVRIYDKNVKNVRLHLYGNT